MEKKAEDEKTNLKNTLQCLLIILYVNYSNLPKQLVFRQEFWLHRSSISLSISLVFVFLPDLSVLCEGGHGCALRCVVLRQAGADLQYVGLPWLGNHHGVVQWSRYRALGLGLSLGRLLRLTLGLEMGKVGKKRGK